MIKTNQITRSIYSLILIGIVFLIKPVPVFSIDLQPNAWINTYNDSGSWLTSESIVDFTDVEPTPDGGSIALGIIHSSAENDKTKYMSLFKLDDTGNIINQKYYFQTDFSNEKFSNNFSNILSLEDGNFIIRNSGFYHGDPTSTMRLAKINSSGDILWTKEYWSGNNHITATKFALLSDGGFLAAGTKELHVSWLMRLNSDGEIIWGKNFSQDDDGSYNYYWPISMVQENSQGIILAFGKTGELPLSTALVQLNHDGTILWQKIVATDGNIKSVNQDGAGNFVLGVSKNAPIAANSKNKNLIVIKMDQQGNVIWQNSVGFNFLQAYAGWSLSTTPQIIITKNQEILVSAFSQNNLNTSYIPFQVNIETIKFDIDGVLEWKKSLGVSLKYTEWVNKYKETADNGFMLSGNTRNNAPCIMSGYCEKEGSGSYILKVNAKGSVAGCQYIRQSALNITTSGLEIKMSNAILVESPVSFKSNEFSMVETLDFTSSIKAQSICASYF